MTWGMRGPGGGHRGLKWVQDGGRWTGQGPRQGQSQGTLGEHGVGRDKSPGDLRLGRSCRITLGMEDWVGSAIQPQLGGRWMGGRGHMSDQGLESHEDWTPGDPESLGAGSGITLGGLGAEAGVLSRQGTKPFQGLDGSLATGPRWGQLSCGCEATSGTAVGESGR